MFSPSLLYSIFPLLLTPYLTTTYISPEPHPIFLASLLSISTDPYPIFPPSLLYISPNFILYFLHPYYIFHRSLPYISSILTIFSPDPYPIFPPSWLYFPPILTLYFPILIVCFLQSLPYTSPHSYSMFNPSLLYISLTRHCRHCRQWGTVQADSSSHFQ